MATSSRRSSGPVMPVRRRSDASPFTTPFASSTSYHSLSRTSGFFSQRSSSSPAPPTPSVRFAIDRSISPRRSIAAVPQHNQVVRQSNQKRTCMCSPTTHPGSFRCALHKNTRNQPVAAYSPNRLNMRRSAMTNSLVRIGTVEGDLVKRALATLIRPSSHQQRRRADFQRRPSRLSVMSKTGELS